MKRIRTDRCEATEILEHVGNKTTWLGRCDLKIRSDWNAYYVGRKVEFKRLAYETD